MKSRAKRLDPLRRLAENREQGALHLLAREQARDSAARARLQELQAYLEQYSDEAQAAAVTSVAQLALRSRFVERLREAVRIQEGVVRRVGRELDRSRDVWSQEFRERRSLDVLRARLERGERGAEARREQRELDEVAGRFHRPPRRDS